MYISVDILVDLLCLLLYYLNLRFKQLIRLNIIDDNTMVYQLYYETYSLVN